MTKATNSVLNLVNPPIDNMVLLMGTLDNVVIGSHVPNIGYFTNLAATVGNVATLISTTINATNAYITGLTAGNASIQNLNSTTAYITNLTAANGNITNLGANVGQINYLSGQNISYVNATFQGATIGYGVITNLTATNGFIGTLNGNDVHYYSGNINTFSSVDAYASHNLNVANSLGVGNVGYITHAQGYDLSFPSGYIGSFSGGSASITNVTVGYNLAVGNYAYIPNANIPYLSGTNLGYNSGNIDVFYSNTGTFNTQCSVNALYCNAAATGYLAITSINAPMVTAFNGVIQPLYLGNCMAIQNINGNNYLSNVCGGGGGGGGIGEAPIDGNYYSRRNAGWAVNNPGGSGLETINVRFDDTYGVQFNPGVLQIQQNDCMVVWDLFHEHPDENLEIYVYMPQNPGNGRVIYFKIGQAGTYGNGLQVIHFRTGGFPGGNFDRQGNEIQFGSFTDYGPGNPAVSLVGLVLKFVNTGGDDWQHGN